MKITKMVSMARSKDEMKEAYGAVDVPGGLGDGPSYPYGLCLTLTDVELEKLDLDDNPEIGDIIHLIAMARVTSISKRNEGGKDCCRIELQIEDLGLEDETTEYEDEE